MSPSFNPPVDPAAAARRALRLQHSLDQHAIVSITDAAGRITFANEMFCAISGYQRAELIGQTHRILKSGVHPPELYADMWRTIAAGRTWHGDICNRNKAGGFYWVRATITPFMNERGEPEEYVAIRTEITSQKELEKLSRRREAWLRTVLDNLGEGVYTLDAEGKLDYFNAEAERLLGWRLDELVGKGLHEIIHHHRPDGRPLPAAECPVHSAMLEHRVFRSGDEVFFHKDGSPLPVKIAAAPLLLEGQRLGSVAVFSDMREERLLQQRLFEAKEAAEAATRLKADFLSTMSHEIRTPLNGVIGMTDLLLDTPLDNEQTEFARIIKMSADALLAIIDDILDFSKIEAGRLELEHTEFSLRGLIGGSLDVLAARAQEKELRLTSWIAAELPDRLVGDPTRLRQILLNFLSNAIKFTARGEIMVSAESVADAAVDRDLRRPLLGLAVRDSGIGLSQAAIAELFRPFSQADSSTTRKYGGTGLGLSICKRLVEAMGGEIGVDSRPGEGSSFWVRIPLEVAGAAQESPAAARATRLPPPASAESGADGDAASRRPVLLAEDNPINQRVAVHLLHRLGYAVDVVDNGAQAVAAVAAGNYALVLMDCQMPEMDGFAATAAIRRAEADAPRRLPIVAMTANALQGDRERCLRVGMDDYISKPIDAVRLAALLATWLPGGAEHGGVDDPAPRTGLDSAPAAIDMKRLIDLFGDDVEVIDELLTLLRQSLQTLDERLGRELAERGDGLRGLAHEMRGTTSNIGALPLAELAGRLEDLAVHGNWSEIEPLAASIGKEIVRIDDFVTHYKAQRKT